MFKCAPAGPVPQRQRSGAVDVVDELIDEHLDPRIVGRRLDDRDVACIAQIVRRRQYALEDDPRRDRVRRECRNEPGEEGDEHGWSRAHGGQNLSATDVE